MCYYLAIDIGASSDLLMMPEYLMWKLCGTKARKYTNATALGNLKIQMEVAVK